MSNLERKAWSCSVGNSGSEKSLRNFLVCLDQVDRIIFQRLDELPTPRLPANEAPGAVGITRDVCLGICTHGKYPTMTYASNLALKGDEK